MLPPGIGIAGGAIDAPEPSLYPEEEAVVQRAVQKRRSEFRAGRARAREALAQIGASPAAILRGSSGEPVWPTGFTGSIAHSEDFAIALAAPLGVIRAIGVDLDDAAPLDPELMRFICRTEELDRLRRTAGDGRASAKSIFVAKEAFLKLSHTLTGRVPDFLEVSIEFGATAIHELEFRASCPERSCASAADLQGHLGWRRDKIAAVMFARAEGAPGPAWPGGRPATS